MQTTIDVLGGMFDSTTVVKTVDGFPKGDKAVDAAFFARMMQCFYSDGVVRPAAGHLQVQPDEGMRVQVTAGCGWIDGHMGWVQETACAYVEAGHSYLVTLRLHRTDGKFTLCFLEDQSGITRNDTMWELLLAVVTVPGNAVAVTTAMIQDKRMDGTVCGAVNSPIDGLDAVSYAAEAGSVGGIAGTALVPKSGCHMTGLLYAKNDTTGLPTVRNIRYGTALPAAIEDGEIFILLAEEA